MTETFCMRLIINNKNNRGGNSEQCRKGDLSENAEEINEHQLDTDMDSDSMRYVPDGLIFPTELPCT